jgi:hypothetical protein
MSNEESIIFYAFRYALGRHSYAVGQVAQYIISKRDTFSQQTKDLIVKEIKEHQAQWNQKPGEWECDTQEWNAVVSALSQTNTMSNKEY